jgi:hypothetical protein
MGETNTNITLSFNETFCAELEYHISTAFKSSPDKKIKFFWCDGVKMPFSDIQLTKQNILRTKQIFTKAFIGENGQELYEMIILLGSQSIEACINDKSLKNYLPGAESIDWIKLDTVAHTIVLQLN